MEGNATDKAGRAELVTQRDATEDEAVKAGFQKSINELDARVAQRDKENDEYGRVIADREAEAGRMNGLATTASENATALEKINTAVEKIEVKELNPAKAKRDKLQAELTALEERRDKGLYKEALEKAAMIIDSHERFVSELEALVVADKAAQQPPAPTGPLSR